MVRRFIIWYKARRFAKKVEQVNRFINSYNRAMIKLNIPRQERKQRLRELVNIKED